MIERIVLYIRIEVEVIFYSPRCNIAVHLGDPPSAFGYLAGKEPRCTWQR
jgi:hypothetical protein